MVSVERYEASEERNWDQFLGQARNAHFMFNRRYMEYHSDRFEDHSLIIRKKNKIVALLPANQSTGNLISHQGLTYGGVICGNKMSQSLMIDSMDAILTYATESGFRKLIYKAIPYIYSKRPTQEDLYSLFRHQAKLFRRDASSVIQLSNRSKYRSTKTHGLKKAQTTGMVAKPMSLDRFWPILETVLASEHATKPAHTLEEISLLQNRFPDNVICRGAFLNDKPVAGTVLFASKPVVHTQYLANNEDGRTNSALDFVIDSCIQEFTKLDYEFFSFGISTEEQGTVLNEGLIFHKEGFGASSVCHDQYEIELS